MPGFELIGKKEKKAVEKVFQEGGVLFAISDSLNLPIRFIGIGEAIDDLKPFNARDFVDALFD